MMPLKGGQLATASANSLGAVALFGFTVSADEAIIAAHKSGGVRLVAFEA
jgi:hypothetical protein